MIHPEQSQSTLVRDAATSVLAYSREMRVGRPTVLRAMTELTGLLSMAAVNELLLSPEDQQLVTDCLKIIHPQDLANLQTQGYILSSELPLLLGVAKGTAFRHLHALYPEWRSTFPTVAQGQRRVAVLPPAVVEQLRRYSDLSSERQQLSIWRSQYTRGVFKLYQLDSLTKWLEEHKVPVYALANHHSSLLPLVFKTETTLPPLSDVEEIRVFEQIKWGALAQKILDSQDLISITDDERSWLADLVHGGKEGFSYVIMSFASDFRQQIEKRLEMEYPESYHKYHVLFLALVRRLNRILPSLLTPCVSVKDTKDSVKHYTAMYLSKDHQE